MQRNRSHPLQHFHCVEMVLLLSLLAFSATAADGQKRINALIVTGIDYPGHHWRETTPVLREILRKDSRMEVEVLEDPYKLDVTDLSHYNVLVLHFMNWEKPDPNEKAKANLKGFVEKGGGLAIVHFACGAFQGWPEYANIAGRIYDRTNTHDPRGVFTVDLAKSNHPITRGMPPSFQTDDELYICLTGNKPIELLATASSKITKRDHPMAFVHQYGKGRVFLTPLGHDVAALRSVGTGELIRRGTEWVAGFEPVESTGQTNSTGNPERMLLDFSKGFEPALAIPQDARLSAAGASTGSVLRVVTGHTNRWPGVALKASNEGWNLSPFGKVVVNLRNGSTNTLRIHCRVDNAGADGLKNCVTGSIALSPGAAGTLQVPLKRCSDSTLGGKLFGMRGYPVAPGGKGTIDPAKVVQILLFVDKPESDQVFDVFDIRAADCYTAPTASVLDADPFFPFIDTFGQYRHKDWPGKTHSLEELKGRAELEQKEFTIERGPNDWDQYGGWKAGPQLKASGFFRVEKLQEKWWLVDPDGRLFWSHGIDCVRSMDVTPIAERENWFEAFPGETEEGKEFISPRAYALKGHYAGQSPRGFSFAGANLRRKYGEEWTRIYPAVIHQRLRSWGLNTIGNWSDEGTRLMRRTPYTDAISSGRSKMIEGSEGYWGKFPDPFESSFKDGLRRSMAEKKNKSAGDRWCIGYFSDNEMSWGDDTGLASAALRSPPTQGAKRALVHDLASKYKDIERLNEAWGTSHVSWEALLGAREAPDQDKARTDLKDFTTKIAEQYFRTVREVVKGVAPNQLYLGCRFAWVNERAAGAAAKYCDVVSYNLYQRSVADFKFNGGADVPLIIGEFHLGALDRGLFHTGLVPVQTQGERAAAYKNYVEGALRHSQIVGTHWFQYMDEPTTGRAYDEENYQIGFVDIADTPYAETIAASREVGGRLYSCRMAK